jgi:hypothetical protein
LAAQNNYDGYDIEPAYKLASEQLAEIDDIEQLCLRSGSKYSIKDSQKEITIEYLNRLYRITIPEVEFSLVDSQEEVQIRDKVLILHYLISAKGTAVTNRQIAFNELPGGNNYFRTFSKRVIEPLVEHFGRQPGLLINAAERLGSRKVDYGDAGIVVDAFNRVPVTLIVWQGDDEFAPRGNVLFDAAAPDYLSTYDINVLCESIVWKLIKFLREE